MDAHVFPGRLTGEDYPLAFVVLAHGEWSTLARLVDVIAADPCDTVVIHVDSRLDWRKRKAVSEYFKPRTNVLVVSEVRCKWGGIGLVDATLASLRHLQGTGRAYGHVSLLSGTDYPIKPVNMLRSFLFENSNCQFIEAYNFYTERWIMCGIYAERFEYWFPFARSGLFTRPFQLWYRLMIALDIRRPMDPEFIPYSGSQWWTLGRDVLEWILRDAKTNKLRARMKSTFIPDEMFFQTLIMSSPFSRSVVSRNLRHIEWLPTGTPRVFSIEDLDCLRGSSSFFCRKLIERRCPNLLKTIETELLGRRARAIGEVDAHL